MNVYSAISQIGWRDYLALCKPKVVLLLALTAVIGMLLARPGLPDAGLFMAATLGIVLMSASAAALNHIADQRIDRIMARTRKRPLPQGKVDPFMAMVFAATIGLAGMFILVLWVNVLTAWLTLASLVGYALIYTLFLKRATPQNIVIGGLAGAAPPMLGWTAITGSIEPNSLLLVLIIFAWTPPHFWALAIHRKDEYAKAEIPMLPVTHGVRFTKLQIMLYTLILMVVSVLPYLAGMSGELYVMGALGLGFRFLQWSYWLLTERRPQAAIRTFKYSIKYLMYLFLLLLVDHYLVILL